MLLKKEPGNVICKCITIGLKDWYVEILKVKILTSDSITWIQKDCDKGVATAANSNTFLLAETMHWGKDGIDTSSTETTIGPIYMVFLHSTDITDNITPKTCFSYKYCLATTQYTAANQKMATW